MNVSVRSLIVERAIAHEDDSSVGGVARRDVVAVGRLIGNFHDHRRRIGIGNHGIENAAVPQIHQGDGPTISQRWPCIGRLER